MQPDATLLALGPAPGGSWQHVEGAGPNFRCTPLILLIVRWAHLTSLEGPKITVSLLHPHWCVVNPAQLQGVPLHSLEFRVVLAEHSSEWHVEGAILFFTVSCLGLW